ncbi:MAG: hypothetical protein ACRDI3_01050 [Actinomycetota bacterium]
MTRLEASHQAQSLARALERLPGIQTVEVRSGPAGIESVNVLVSEKQNPDETISDVFATAAISLDSELDPSMVKIKTAPEVRKLPRRIGPRGRLASLALSRNEDDFVASVALDRSNEVLVGECRSALGLGSEHRSVATATLEAVAPLLRYRLELEDVDIVEVGGSKVAVVLLTKGDDSLVGSAVVKVDEDDAIARSTLDALNRLISEAAVPAA